MSLYLTLLTLSHSALALPQQLTQQGRLLNSDGSAIEGQHNLTVRLYESGSSSDSLWEETTMVLFSNGHYMLTIGADSSNPLDNTLLEQYPLYMELELNNEGPFSPRQMLKSAPYARLSTQAENLSGGTVNATQISIGETLIIDSSGSWVGPTITTTWSDLLGIPADLQDGDNDTLANLSCGMGELLSWGGSSWICTSDATRSEEEIIDAVTAQTIDLAFGSMVAGSTILTTTDTLSVSWDNVTDIPFDLADGDDDSALTEGEVETYISNGAIDLNQSTTIAGKNIVTSTTCTTGEVLSYDADAESWICTSFQALLDNDGDGFMTWADCNDDDASIGSNTTDGDCDGVPSDTDCNDSDSSILSSYGSSSSCPAESCQELLSTNPLLLDDVYWIAPEGTPLEVFCDMTTDSGGWLVLQHDTVEHIMTGAYGTPSSDLGWSLDYLDSNSFIGGVSVVDFYIEVQGEPKGIIKDVTLFGSSTRPTTSQLLNGSTFDSWSCNSDSPDSNCFLTDGNGRHWGRWVNNSSGCCIGEKGWWYYSHNDTSTYNYGICQDGYPNGLIATGTDNPTGCTAGYYTSFPTGSQPIKVAIRY